MITMLNKHKFVHISCEVEYPYSIWVFLCRYLTIYLLKHTIDGAGSKKFLKMQNEISTEIPEKNLSQYVECLICASMASSKSMAG